MKQDRFQRGALDVVVSAVSYAEWLKIAPTQSARRACEESLINWCRRNGLNVQGGLGMMDYDRVIYCDASLNSDGVVREKPGNSARGLTVQSIQDAVNKASDVAIKPVTCSGCGTLWYTSDVFKGSLLSCPNCNPSNPRFSGKL